MSDFAFIPLDKGQIAVISACQAHLVEGIKWHATWNKKSRTYYAAALVPDRRLGREGMMRGILMHRLLCKVLDKPGFIVHHRDGNGLNNTEDNLYPCSPLEHGQWHKRHGYRPEIPPHVIAGYTSPQRRVTQGEFEDSWPAHIPYGTCQCGCKQPTEIVKVTQRSSNWFAGKPKPFLHRHSLRIGPKRTKRRKCADGAYKTPKPPMRIRVQKDEYKRHWPAHIPLGMCQCGCDRPTDLAPLTDRGKLWFKGQPKPFLDRHSMRLKESPKKGREFAHPNIHPFRYLDGSPKYSIDESTGCWNWVGGKCSGGYGESTYGYKKKDRAHRVSWRFHNDWREIPKGWDVHHKCSNRACVNPEHLELLIKLDHMRKSPNVKLSLEIADAIKIAYSRGDVTMRYLAKQYDIHSAHVSRIVSGKVWASANNYSVRDRVQVCIEGERILTVAAEAANN